MGRWLLRLITHGIAVAVGFAAGIYVLPILTAPAAPTDTHVQEQMRDAPYSATFRRDLEGSDWLHWGEGQVWVSPKAIALMGRLAPGPDYKLYLTTAFVDTEAAFERLRPQAVRVGDVRTFDNFLVMVPDGIDVSRYNTVVVWCESFDEFITAAQYQ